LVSEPLGLSPDQLRVTAQHLADVSGGMKAVSNTLKARLEGQGPAWGDDAVGDQFAKGNSGYVAQRDWVFDSINAKTDLLDGYAASMRQAADTLENQDRV
jgi:hypothetical protein